MTDELAEEIAAVINRHCAENESDTPDFILADYLMMCLVAFGRAVRRREKWYGRTPRNNGLLGFFVGRGPYRNHRNVKRLSKAETEPAKPGSKPAEKAPGRGKALAAATVAPPAQRRRHRAPQA